MDLLKTAIGIEFGSTRIKAVMIDNEGHVLASGFHDWENKLLDGYWTYSIEDIKFGLQDCFKSLKDNFKETYKQALTTSGALGISAMMHGYMVFDKNDNILVPFRTWRNVNAQKAADELTKLFDYHIPARWSIAHLYQAILNNEEHVEKIAFQTTLEGYVHYLLTGKKVIGIGEASGMFPIDPLKKNFDRNCLFKFNKLLKEKGYTFTLEDIFPKVLLAGEESGELTKEGALLLDPTGEFKCGVKMCPPEGDAETGMIATNSIKQNTGNVSTGTSIFGEVVLNKPLKHAYPEIDLVATPMGDMVAMVHANNCTSEINAWVNLFNEVLTTFNVNVDKNDLFTTLFKKSLEGDKDASEITSFNYTSGESITHVDNGRPMMVRKSESKFTLANVMLSQIYSSFATMMIGFDSLYKEGVEIKEMAAHGGLLKTPGVAQKYLASALKTPVSTMKTAGEGGAWGIAILASFMNVNMSLEEYLDKVIFKDSEVITEYPDEEISKGFDAYMSQYKKALNAEQLLSEDL